MDASWVREKCRSFPGCTEHVIWGNDLTFKVGGKMFAHVVLEPAAVWLSFKTAPEKFFELTERPDIVPAPYLARARWVALQTREALPPAELSGLLRESHELVVAKLPKKIRERLAAQTTPRAGKLNKRSRARRASREREL